MASAKVTSEKVRIWDNYKVVAEVQKSDRLKLVIAAGVRDGVKVLSVREFYFVKRDNAWKPGRDGITVPLAIPTEKGTKIIKPVDDFMAGVNKAVETLDDMPLSDVNNAVYIEKKAKE